MLSRLAGSLVISALTVVGVIFVTSGDSSPSRADATSVLSSSNTAGNTESRDDATQSPSSGSASVAVASGQELTHAADASNATLAGKVSRGDAVSNPGRGNGPKEDKGDRGRGRGKGTTTSTAAPPTTSAPVTSTTLGPTTSSTVASSSTSSLVVEAGVVVEVGVNIQGLVDSHPSGTSFVLKTGTHRNQKVVPKDGMTFVGEPGAVMDGGNKTDAAFSNGGANVTIRNLIIQNYNTPAQRGAIEAAGDNWKIIDNEIRYNAGAGLSLGGDGFIVDGNNIHHNEQIGIIGQNASGAKVTGNEISYNNPNDRYDYGWESGGTKFLRTTNLYIANNNVHDNHGPGLWADHDNYNTTYEKNTVRDNYGPGILHEISYDANITNNTVTGNAHRFYVGGILIASSPNVEVKGNTLNSNDGGIIGLQDNRGSGNRGTYQTTGLNVHNNNVTWTNGFHGIQVNAGPDITKTNTINYDHNTYTTNQTNSFKWGTTSHNFQQWQTLGQDPNSTIN
jgi:parallel beta-helix repeat protein